MALQLELAQDVLLRSAKIKGKEEIGLADSWRRVLAEPVCADMDYPPFDRSPLDGYAIIAAEVAKATPAQPVVLQQVDYVPAGATPSKEITAGSVCRIMTGAPLPPGATGVVRIEDTAVEGDQISFFAGAGADKNICRKGEEIVCGEQVLAAGTLINAGVMGMLAVLGKARPIVHARPKVGLIATGSEIIPVGAKLTPGKIRNSNSYMLSAQAAAAGAEVVMLGQVEDDVDEIAALLQAGADCDVVITTGGASVGDYDLIGTVYKKMGIALLFDRVGIKPGMPVLAGLKDGKLYLGLSGNPAAAAVSFEMLARPTLLQMAGCSNWQRPQVQAVLAVPFTKSSGVKRFVWASCWQENRELKVQPLRAQGNGMLKSVITANAMIVIPENSPPLAAGEQVQVMLLADFGH